MSTPFVQLALGPIALVNGTLNCAGYRAVNHLWLRDEDLGISYPLGNPGTIVYLNAVDAAWLIANGMVEAAPITTGGAVLEAYESGDQLAITDQTIANAAVAAGITEWPAIVTPGEWPVGGFGYELEGFVVGLLQADSIIGASAGTIKTHERWEPQPEGEIRQYGAAELPALSVKCTVSGANYGAAHLYEWDISIEIEAIAESGEFTNAVANCREYAERAGYIVDGAVTSPTSHQCIWQDGFSVGEPTPYKDGIGIWSAKAKITGTMLVPTGE